ncbi:MAG: sugar isomerase domain-containing protein [Erysipelotrichaceae bacterium]
MKTSKDFFEVVKQNLFQVKESQRENIFQAAKMLGDCMGENGVVQLFGVDAGYAFSMELGYRAGGLMPFHIIKNDDLALRGYLSEAELYDRNINNREELARNLYGLYRIEPNDLFLICDYGNLAITIEMALLAKNFGHTVVAVVNKKLNESIDSNHSSGKKIMEIADLVIDNCAEISDAITEFDGEHKINQVASINGNVIAQMLTAETYSYIKSLGKDCPILLSANIKGADVHNRKLSDKYLARWNS